MIDVREKPTHEAGSFDPYIFDKLLACAARIPVTRQALLVNLAQCGSGKNPKYMRAFAAVQREIDESTGEPYISVEYGEIGTNRAPRFYLSRYRERLQPFLRAREGDTYDEYLEYEDIETWGMREAAPNEEYIPESDILYVEINRTSLLRLIEQLTYYPILTRSGIQLALGNTSATFDSDLRFLIRHKTVSVREPLEDGRKRGRYYLTRWKDVLEPFLKLE